LNQTKKIVVIGASSSIAEHCARLWALEKPTEMILVGRNSDKLDTISQDLKVRSPNTQFTNMLVDFESTEAIRALVNDVFISGSVDLVLIAHGSLPDQLACQSNLTDNHQALMVNGLSPVWFAEAFAQRMEMVNQGTIALIGSVAGDKGRKSNYIYGAAKGLVTRYVQGMQHRFAKTNVSVVLIKPGPTDTPMTAQLKQQGQKLASVESVANNIVKGINSKKTVIYTPAKWQIIMMIIRHLPNFIFNKLEI
jgi:decaprenylphospho-beta-D-erythro-pentofuranosid-2-ulose 2-reductase